MDAKIAPIALVFLFAACGDDGNVAGGRSPLNAAARSDGTVAGDIAALQYRQSERMCACLEEQALVSYCIDTSWPSGQLECVREAYGHEAARNMEGLTCFREALEAVVDCQLMDSCGDEAIDTCFSAFQSAVARCPQSSEAFDQEYEGCFGLLDGEASGPWGTEEVMDESLTPPKSR